MITPQSANWTTLATARGGRPLRLQAYIEGIPDVLCTDEPPDERTKTYAINFDGSNDYIDCGTNAALTELADWTVCAWVKPTGFAAVQRIASWGTVANGVHSVYVDTSGALSVSFKNGTGGFPGAGTALTANAWNYCAMSLGGNTKTVFRAVVNSTDQAATYESVTRASRTITAGTNNFNIGIYADGTSWPFGGRIGYVAVFNRALSHVEMRRLKYRIISKAWGNDDSEGLWDDCVAQWDFERGSGTNLTNTKLPGTHDGTLTSGPTWVSDACYSVTYRPVLSARASTSQDIDPLGTRTSIQATELRILDTDEWFTTMMKSSNLNLKLPRKEVRLFLGMSGLLESEYQPVAAGPILDFSFHGAAYSIRFGDNLSNAKRRINLGRAVLQSALTDVATTCQVTASAYFHSYPDDDSEYSYIKIDDELIRFATDDAVSTTAQQLGTAGTPLVRGEGDSNAAAHDNGAAVREVWHLASTIDAGTQLLRLLCSGAGYQSVNTYDRFLAFAQTTGLAINRKTEPRGLGLTESDVAVAEIAALIAADTVLANAYTDPWIDDASFDVKDLIEAQILRPAGAYLFVKSDGRISMARHSIPAATVHALDPDQVVRATWSITHEHVVNFVAVEHTWNSATEAFDAQYFASDATSGTDYGLKKREYSFKGVSGTTQLDSLKGEIFARFGQPYITGEVTCGLAEFLVEIGDAISFTDMHLPNITTGLRGIHGQLWQVVGRQADFGTGQVRLTLADLSRV